MFYQNKEQEMSIRELKIQIREVQENHKQMIFRLEEERQKLVNENEHLWSKTNSLISPLSASNLKLELK